MNRDAFTENLLHRWTEMAGRYSDDSSLIRKLFIEIESAYNSTGRYYHALPHIQYLLKLSDEFENLLHDKEIVDFSIFYHDVVYDVSRSDNEEKSALLAEGSLAQLKLPPEKVLKIVRYIIASKTHQLNEADREADLSWFLDFDMSILGCDWETYSHYLQDVRKEYLTYPDKIYAKGRSEFLLRTLNMPFIFNTSHFRTTHERQAWINMERELSLLGALDG
jgi:predicted metal-dependent HD superfamily phosphohydrolase